MEEEKKTKKMKPLKAFTILSGLLILAPWLVIVGLKYLTCIWGIFFK